MKIQKHIEIVRSTIPALSSLSNKSSQSIYNVLRSAYSSVGITAVNNQEDLQALAAKQPDLVFLGLKYVPGSTPDEKIWVSEFLNSHGIVHTGSGQRAIELELDKSLAKQQVGSAGVPTANSLVVSQGQVLTDEAMTLRFPLFVKPTSLGGGAGINETSRVDTMDELQTQISYINDNFSSEVLVEEYLPGREFSVALLRDVYTDSLEVMPIELAAPYSSEGESVLSQEVKNSNQEVVLPVTDPALRSHIITTATDAFNAIGGRDYGRIDIRLDDSGTANFLEANLIPSLISGYGSFPKACVINLDMGYEAMILAIVGAAFSRAAEYSIETSTTYTGVLSPLPLPV